MHLAIAVICTGLAASLFDATAVDVTISQVIMLAVNGKGQVGGEGLADDRY